MEFNSKNLNANILKRRKKRKDKFEKKMRLFSKEKKKKKKKKSACCFNFVSLKEFFHDNALRTTS